MMFVRWLLAAPLLLASYVGTPIAYLVTSTWVFRTKFGKEFDLREEAVDKFATYAGSFWPVPLAILLFACTWWMTSAWPRIALVPTVPLAVGGVFSGDLRVVLALAAPAVGWGLAWLAGRIVSRPVTADLCGTAIEVVLKLRGGGRIRLQSRRLLIDKLPNPTDPRAPVGRLAIPYDRITHVEPGAVLGQTRWQLANSSVLTIEPGQVLRVIGGGQEWLLPVDDAHELAGWIHQRAQVRQQPEPRPALENSRWALAKVLWELEPADDVARQPVKHGMHHLRLVASVLCAAMAGFATYRIFTDGVGYLIGAGFFGLVAFHCLKTWRSVGVSLRLAEENPRPPMTPGPDARRAPVPGWSVSVHPIGR